MSNQLVALIANIALTLSVIVAVIFGIAQVKTAAKDRRERLTLDTLRGFHTREFVEIMLYVYQTKIPATQEEWLKWPKEDKIIFAHIGQEMETLGLLLAERLINIDLVDKTLGSFVTVAWENCKPLILDLREKTNDPFMSEYFQWMAEQLDKRMKEKPRKPFFETSKIAY
jgi:hypothetical protein